MHMGETRVLGEAGQPAPREKRRWLTLPRAVYLLTAIGTALAALSLTGLCDSSGCTETHLYRLFGLKFGYVGLAAFPLLALAFAAGRRWPKAGTLFGLCCAGGAASEVVLILLQKNVIKAWCWVCLAIGAVLLLLAVTALYDYFVARQRRDFMGIKFWGKLVLVLAALLVGFTGTVMGVSKPDPTAKPLDLFVGNAQSRVEVYVFTDWYCPGCIKVEPAIAQAFIQLAPTAKFLFADKVIHPEAMNYVPYNVGLALSAKPQYIKLRGELAKLAAKTRHPKLAEVTALASKAGVSFEPPEMLDIARAMTMFEGLAQNFKINSTPTVVVRNSKTKQIKTLAGSDQISTAAIVQAVAELK